MTVGLAQSPHPATPMRGPVFVMAKIQSWTEHPGAESRLELTDGSKWRIDANRRDYQIVRGFIELARKYNEALLLSGNGATGEVDHLASTQCLVVQEVISREHDGSIDVIFFGPPSVYRLRMSIPGVRQALALLRQSAVSGASFSNPDLLVGIDTLTSEIVAVSALK